MKKYIIFSLLVGLVGSLHSAQSDYYQNTLNYSVDDSDNYGTGEDNQILKRIRNAIRNNTIQVEVKNGTVTLQGAVASQKEKKDLEEKTRNVKGVITVRNLIVVNASEKPSRTPSTQKSSSF